MSEINNIKFCPDCNFAINQVKIDQADCQYSCPNCGFCNISDFYSIGSTTHKTQIELYKDMSFEYIINHKIYSPCLLSE